jgi:hypothetical protein
MLFEGTKNRLIMNTNVTENNSVLQGCYEINNKTLVNTSDKGLQRLVIGTRKKPTPTKPTNYILSKQGGKYNYVSSMYPTTKDDLFKLEYNGVCYDMTPTDIGYDITPTTDCR